ncbi:MAG: bifunctional 23S rRNA (guanine(2069)-N(7))-methyltransferase RlmK/23S rRNA (guanine(2445)-N(2))-methyltransferase RlmL [Steroidobacteraceae bacterium]
MTLLRFVATVPRGFADLLAEELRALGASDVKDRSAGVSFSGTLEIGYRACLESRLASRILVELKAGPFEDANGLYDLVRSIDWREHIDSTGTLACEFTGQHAAIGNSHFGALKVKDAICDQLRESTGSRPDIETTRPSLRVHVHAARGQGSVLIDLAGEALSRRGYRIAGGEAPLRENLAAGILLRAQWPRIAAAGGEFLDPMCGSGTLAIEAAFIAANIAPGLLRDYFGFQGWRGHDATLWESVRDAALGRASQQIPCVIRGSDRSGAAIATARANARRAGVGRDIVFEQIELAAVKPAQDSAEARGLLCVNPPYGERIGQGEDAGAAHEAIGVALRERFPQFDAVVLTGEPVLGQRIGIDATRVHTVFNGAIECRLLRFAAGERRARRRATGVVLDEAPALAASPGARMFANRLQKNLQHLGKLARRQGVGCYRLYDADMPEYALAIDHYAGTAEEAGQRWLFVQEYAPPATIEPEAAQRRREEALSVLPEVTGIPLSQIHLRVRRKQKGTQQYNRAASRGARHVVDEAGLQFLVNFEEYLDTGLFLDHRDTRARIRAAASGKRFLNLFCYTGSVTVHAAAGGATRTVSVDLSRTYLDWARDNLERNGFGSDSHLLVQADCLQWLEEAHAGGASYDLIFLDPPTFSNSARMNGVLDIQRDQSRLVEGSMKLLARDGLLIFSNNLQKFDLDPALAERFDVREISSSTVPFDYRRNLRIHRCFEIRHR